MAANDKGDDLLPKGLEGLPADEAPQEDELDLPDPNLSLNNLMALIPVGLATQVSRVVAVMFGVIALITAVIEGDHSQETITALAMAGITVWVMMGGRYYQAGQLLKSVPPPNPTR